MREGDETRFIASIRADNERLRKVLKKLEEQTISDASYWRWRVGTHYGIHVYAIDPEFHDMDLPVCTALTAEFAEKIVSDHNAQIAATSADVPPSP